VGLLAYAADYLTEDEPLLAARANAADLGGTEPVPPAVGAALRFLACAVGAKATVEIGTGCGSSGIWLLRGMRPGGTLTSVDTEPEYQRLARKAFVAAGFAQNQCRLILGRALDVLPRLSDGAYDMVFCDADAQDYPDYLAAAMRLLRPGGVVAFNNALLTDPDGDEGPSPGADPEFGEDPAFGGNPAFGADQAFGAPGREAFDGPGPEDPALGVADRVRADDRLVPVLLPLGDGLLAAVKKGD
jgi:predicted O-methyltransferase YrrM